MEIWCTTMLAIIHNLVSLFECSLTLLLDIACLTLEAGILSLAIDKHITSDHTHGGTMRKHVQ